MTQAVGIGVQCSSQSGEVNLDIPFSNLFEVSPNPYVLMDLDFRLVWMNRAYLAVTMRAQGDIINRTMFEAFPSDPDSESFRLLDRSLRRVRETGEADEIALIRYDIANPDGSMETRYWSATHTPIHDDQDNLKFILQHTVDVTELHKLRQMRAEMGLVQRAERIQARNRDLARESDRLMEFFHQAPGFVAVLGGPDHVFQMTNAAYLKLIGRSDVSGKSVADALPEVVAQGFLEVLDDVYRDGTPYIAHRETVVLEGGNDPAHAKRVLNFIFQPIKGPADEVTGIIIQGYDVTDEVEYEERQDLLINELNHRVKNMLAVVQALAQQTFRSVPGAKKANATYTARLQALGAAHGLLSAGSWSPASIEEIVRLTVGAAFGDMHNRATLRGPDLLLQPEAALSLTMIVHELTTNAVKYGSLSNQTGQVEIEWKVDQRDEQPCLTFAWREHGGPEVVEPDGLSFGSRLIQRGLGNYAGNSVDMDFNPDGLSYFLEAEISDELLYTAEPAS